VTTTRRPAHRGRGARAAVLSALLAGAVAAVLAVSATPAAAHGVGGTEPSNYRTRVLRVDPPGAGVAVEVIDAGTRLAVRNDGPVEVVILGYDGEPYLRVGPSGVFENRRAPTAWLNRSRYATTEPPPPEVDAGADPRWERISSGTTARFHWHLAHWMSPSRPPAVRDDPGAVHLLAEWDLVMVRDGERIVASGDLRWVPGPSPVPYVLGALGAAVVMIVAGRTRLWRIALGAGLAMLVASETVHVVGLWNGSSAGLGARLLANVYSLGGIALGALALARVADPRRDALDGTPLALLAGLVLAVAGGLADLGTLDASVLPTANPAVVARASVAVTLGVGGGVLAVAAMHLRRPVAQPAAAPP
jgi:hypothetical protein